MDLQNIIIKGDVKKLRRKGKSLKSKETRGKFNIGKSIKNRPKDVRKREKFWTLGIRYCCIQQRKVKSLPFNFCRKKKQIFNCSGYG